MALNNYFAQAKNSVYRVVKNPTTGVTKNFLVDPSKYDALNVPNALRPKTTTPATSFTAPASPIPTLGYLTSKVNAIQAPTYQTWKPAEFQKPTFNFSSDEQVQSKANAQLSPAFTAALERLRQDNYRNLWDTAEGLSQAGMGDTGAKAGIVTQREMLNKRNVEDVSLQQQSQLMALIDSLKQREMQQADQEYNRAWQQYETGNRLGIDAANMANDVAYKGYQGQFEPLNLLSGLEGTVYQRDRDKIADEREANKFENQPGYNDLVRRKTLAEIANAERDAKQPYFKPDSGNSGSSGGTGGLTPTQARTAGYAQNFDAAARSLLNYKSFDDMIEDVKRMTPEQAALLGPGGWNKLMDYANSGAVRSQYFDQYKEPITPSGFKSGSRSPLRGVLGGTPATKATSKPKTSLTTTKPAQTKTSGVYSEALGIIKGSSKKNALNYVNDPQVKAALGAEHARIVKHINANFK